MSRFRKKPVVVEAWPVRELNRAAEHDWQALPESVRADYEKPQGKGAWVFGALIEALVCTVSDTHGPHDSKARYCFMDGSPLQRTSRRGIYVPTLEGNLFADPGDWIIRGVNGEFYPCKPDIFEKTYNPEKEAEHVESSTA